MAAAITPEQADALLDATPPPKALVNENQPSEPIKVASADNVDQLLGDTQEPKPNKPSLVGDVLRGIDNLQSTGAGLVELLGNATGSESIEQWGHNVRALNDAEAQQNPASIGTYKNIHGAGDLGRYAVEAVLENLAMFVPSAVTGGIGGMVARSAAETYVKNLVAKMSQEEATKLILKRVFIGSTLGGYGSSAAMETGDIYGSTVDETGVKDPAYAIGAGAAAGLFDALPEGKLITNIIGPKVAAQLEKGLITRLGVEGAKQFLREAPTEGIQTIIEQSAITHADPSQDLFADKRVNDYIDSALKGGLAGSVMGAGGEALHGLLRGHPNDQVRAKEEEINNLVNDQVPAGTVGAAVEASVTDEDKKIAEIHQRIDALDEEFKKPETDIVRQQEITKEKADLAAQADAIANPKPAPKATDDQKAEMFWESATDGRVQAGWVGEDPDAFGSKRSWASLTPEQQKKAKESLGLVNENTEPSPGTFQYNEKYGPIANETAALDAVAAGTKDIATVSPDQEELAKKHGLAYEIETTESKGGVRIKTMHAAKTPEKLQEKLAQLRDLRQKRESGQIGLVEYSKLSGKIYGYSDQEIAEFMSKPRAAIAVKKKAVPAKTNPPPLDMHEEAKKVGAIYQGEEMGLHAFKEESTGGNFSVPVAQATPEKIKEKAQAVRDSFPLVKRRLQLEEERQRIMNAGEAAGTAQARNTRLKEIEAQLANDQALDAGRNDPVYQFPENTNLPLGINRDTVNQTREKVHAIVDSLVNEKDDPTKAAQYKGAVKGALDPHLNFLTGQDIQIKKAPRGESYGVNAKADGTIELWVPSMKEWNARNNRQAKSGGLLDTLAFKTTLADHEIIHAAYYSYLRDKWKKAGARGAFDQYVTKQTSQIGDRLTASTRSLPAELAAIYQPTHGPTDSFTTGTEFLRMMVERARTGQLTEDVQIALNAKQRGAVTPFLKVLLDAAQRIREVLARYLNPATSTKTVQEAYAGINAVLDKYGNIQPDRVPASEQPAPQGMPIATARQLGDQPLVNENPPTNAENLAPVRSAADTQALAEAQGQKLGQLADQRRGITPEVRQKYQAQLVGARVNKADVHAAAVTHAQMQMARGERLATKTSRQAARQSFETNLQKKVTQAAYDKAVEEARQSPLAPPVARRNPEHEKIADQTDSTNDEGATSLDELTNGHNEGGRVNVPGTEVTNGTEFNRGLNESLAKRDFGEVSDLIQTSGSPDLHRQLFEDPLEQANVVERSGNIQDALDKVKPPEPIRGEEVAKKLKEEQHAFAPGKRDVSYRPEDDWFSENVLGMPFVTPSRWSQFHDTPIVDWGGDFSDSEKFAGRTNEGASMKSPTTIMDKLREANAAQGSARTLDITGDMGHKSITPDTVAAFDKEFGENNWIVKPKNDSHSRNVFFPEQLKEMGSLVNENLTSKLMVQERWQPMTVQADPNPLHAGHPSMARVHVVTDPHTGEVTVVPFATIDYGKPDFTESDASNYEHVVYETPEVFPTDRIRGFEDAAKKAIESLPLSDRSGSMFSVEVIQTPEGFKIIELNPNFSQYAENGRGGGAHLQNNYAVQDAVLSAMKGELPLHARIAKAALESGGAISRRSPEMQELEGSAHAALDKMFNPTVLVNERERKINVGSRLRFGDFTPMEMEVMSQPKEPSFFAAKEFFDQNGSVMDNANFLLRNPEVHGTTLDGSERTALYKMTMIALDHMRTEFWENPENFVAEEGDHIEQTLQQLDVQYGQFGTEVGRIASSMKDLTPFINGRKSVKDYTKAILQQWKKRFGEKGASVLDSLASNLNSISSNAVKGVITRAEFVAGMRKILADLNNKKWRKAMRQTLVNESAKINGVARRAASRAAEIEFGNLDSEPALKEAARRILNDITYGIPKGDNAEEAPTILSQAISEVTRDVARKMGAIPKGNPKTKVTELAKLSTILQNPELYNEFVQNIAERMHTKFGSSANAQAFHESVNQFAENMNSRTWMNGMIEKVVAEKAKEMKISITKAAKETVGAGRDTLDQLREAITSELKQHGLTDPQQLAEVARDVDSMLDDSVEKAREVWAGKPGAVRKTLKEMGETINRVARQGFTAREQVGNTLAKTFIERLGMANTVEFPHAQLLSDLIQNNLGKLVEAERKNIVKSILRNADPAVQAAAAQRGTRDRRTAIDRIIEMSNVGALTNEKVYSALAEKLGLPKYSIADAQTIQDWGERIGDMNDGREKVREIVKLRDFIESRKGVDWKQMLTAGMYASMLSGPSTHAVNAVSNMLNLMGEVWSQSVLHPTRIPSILRAMFVGLSRGTIELRETIASGVGHKLNQKVEGGNPLEYHDPLYLDKGAEKLGSLLSLTRAKYVVRFLQGVDMMFYKAAQEVSLAGNTGYDGSGDNWASHITDARNQFIAQGREVDSSAGRRAVEVRAMETMEQDRIQGNPELTRAWNEAHGQALTTTFNQEPKGWIGRLAIMIGKYTGEHPSAKLIVPFTRVVANVLNAQIEWSPFGIARYAFSNDFKVEQADGQMVRDDRILVKSITSMLALGALSAMLAKYDDDDDPYFTIYGSGPKDAGKKRQLYEQGWKPNTIKVGGAYYSYLTTPMSLSFASLGTLMDRHREGSTINPLESVPQLGIAFVQGTLSQSFLRGVADLFSAFESSDPDKKVQQFLARTLTIPIPNLVKQIDAWADPSVQQSDTFLDTMIKQVPVARHLLNPMLNVFGQEVNRTPGPLNIPFGNRFVTTRSDDPVYSFLGESQLSVPTYSKSTKLGNDKMTEEQFYEYVKIAGPKVYDAIRRQIPMMRNLSKEDKQQRIDDIANSAKQQARQELRTRFSR